MSFFAWQSSLNFAKCSTIDHVLYIYSSFLRSERQTTSSSSWYVCSKFDRKSSSRILFLWSAHMNSLRSAAFLHLNFSLKNTFNDLTMLRYSSNIISSRLSINLNIRTLINYKYLILKSIYFSSFLIAFLNTSPVAWSFHSLNRHLSAHLQSFSILT